MPDHHNRPRDRDFDFEPQPGLPAPLPAGEAILWQGSPQGAALARQAFRVNWLVAYLLGITLLRAGLGWAEAGPGRALAVALPYLVLTGGLWIVVRLLAEAQARSSIYTVTNARVILRIGAALPVTYTIPFRCIGAAHLDRRPDDTGTIALQLTGGARLSWLSLWPHLRPGLSRGTQPALRCIPDATRVARILADAAQAKLNEPEVSAPPRGAAAGRPAMAAE